MAGIYLHIPFCKQKCSYCDFHFSTTFHSYREKMIKSLVQELITRKETLQDEPIKTIYFGGGTPSLLTEMELSELITTVYDQYQVISSPEITLEANPDDIDEEKVKHWKKAGVNRLSVGLQSFNPAVMKWMNRAHSVEQSLACIPIAQQAGITNISIDLIYGLPDLTMEAWENEIETALKLGVQHISAYCLTIEDKTALASWVKSKKINTPSNELQVLQFQLLQDKLIKAGFDHYEISNFGLPDFYSRHNSSYWKGDKYIGIGPSAHSLDGTHRSWNIANNTRYIKGIESNQPEYDFEKLTPENKFNELLLVGLRTKWGVDLTQLASILPLPMAFTETLNSFILKGWVEQIGNEICLTQDGKSWADKIAEDLFVL
jgi:oxygen-independent coproporphyrinogen-3 oxidase